MSFKVKFEEGVRDVKETLGSPTVGPYVLKAEGGTYLLEGQAATLSTGTLTPHIAPQIRDRLIALADTAPRAAVLEAWLQLETAAEKLILAKVQPAATSSSRTLGMVGPQVLYRHLERLNAVTPEQTESFQKLRKLRNQVVHAAEVSLPLDTVVEYVDLALALSEQFNEEAAKKL